METRNIEVSIDTARKWYNGDNATLKELALQAYDITELKNTVQEALDCILQERHTAVPILSGDPFFLEKMQSLARLNDIAIYLNKGWEKVEGNIGYYIYKDTIYKDSSASLTKHTKDIFKVGKHITVKYPLIYFQNEKDAQKVISHFDRSFLDSVTNFNP